MKKLYILTLAAAMLITTSVMISWQLTPLPNKVTQSVQYRGYGRGLP